MIRAVTAATLLFLATAALMTYTVYALSSTPYLCALMMCWLGFVAYAVASAWWGDLQEARLDRQRMR